MAPAGNPVPSPHVSQYRGLGGGGGMLVPGGALSSPLPMAAVITLFRAGRLVVYFLVSRFSALWCRSARPRVALRGGQEEGLGAPPCTPPPPRVCMWAAGLSSSPGRGGRRNRHPPSSTGLARPVGAPLRLRGQRRAALGPREGARSGAPSGSYRTNSLQFAIRSAVRWRRAFKLSRFSVRAGKSRHVSSIVPYEKPD